ncbi:mycothiol S-conjugate amidase [Glaciihabitans tibetensis]|uniref:Mycothiol S-conjugate amidase n=1 Tax=Glaciihabitans tibetensis TaxID=1266600 RepID=A0A2T0V478_9MICO|nr:mycothiol conjugate amidase Mca [Glaciihabitans tibetensis]PRY64989.1 mycothiol S-conjugate amidase [Glaciihabitans tibetensis]
MTQRLLAVHAHPDDESSKGAATYAYYRSIGTEVMVVSCTGGERGSILNEGLAGRPAAERDLAGVRRREMQRAQAVMGVEHRWLGYQDSGMPDEGEPLPVGSFAAIALEISAEPLVRIIRRYKPQVLVTYDENGGYPHPDHIRTHEVSLFAMRAAADPAQYPDAGDAWQVSKLYYDRIFSGDRLRSVYTLLQERMPESPLIEAMAGMRSWMDDSPSLATTRIPCGDFFEVGNDALRSHASQVAPDSPFFFWPNDLQREAWPTEDFQLIEATVPTELPESDLFAGIPEEGAA